MEKKKWIYSFRLSIIGLLLMMIAIIIAGGGHGLLEPFFILFPYSFLIANYITEEFWIIIILMLIQYPIYGYFMDKKSTHIKRTVVVIVIIHIVFATIAFLNLNPAFK
jgi:hypothetical protein